jgi:hypothetical protein
MLRRLLIAGLVAGGLIALGGVLGYSAGEASDSDRGYFFGFAIAFKVLFFLFLFLVISKLFFFRRWERHGGHSGRGGCWGHHGPHDHEHHDHDDDPDDAGAELVLPGMDSFDVCRALRKDSTVPIIMLTSAGRRDRQTDWAGAWHQRLHYQAVLAPRAGGTGQGHFSQSP